MYMREQGAGVDTAKRAFGLGGKGENWRVSVTAFPKPPPKPVKARKPIQRSPVRKRAKRTRVMPDGREILTGKHWQDRKLECGTRDNFHCRRCRHYTGVFEGEAHHKIKRGMGGGFRDDRLENLEWLCRECHEAEEARGLRTKMLGRA
jgi:hypothetical protein